LQAIRPLDPGFAPAIWQRFAGQQAGTDHTNNRPPKPPKSPPNDEESRKKSVDESVRLNWVWLLQDELE